MYRSVNFSLLPAKAGFDKYHISVMPAFEGVDFLLCPWFATDRNRTDFTTKSTKGHEGWILFFSRFVLFVSFVVNRIRNANHGRMRKSTPSKRESRLLRCSLPYPACPGKSRSSDRAVHYYGTIGSRNFLPDESDDVKDLSGQTAGICPRIPGRYIDKGMLLFYDELLTGSLDTRL